MVKERKRRMASRDAKRLRTLRANKGYDQIIADLQKAGRASPTKFTSETSVAVNKARWAEYYRLNPEKLEARRQKELKKETEK